MSKQKKIRNFARNQTCRPVEFFQPNSREELLGIIHSADDQQIPVGVVGASHSMSDLVNTNGYRLSLDKMNRVLDLNPERLEVTVEAGIRLREIIEKLAAERLSLPMLGSISEQSIAGAISTGTHSSCSQKQVLASLISELELISPTGEVRRYSATEDSQLFDAVRISRGELGLISQMTLQCEPLTGAEERLEMIPLEQLLADLPAWLANDHFRFFWVPGSKRVFTQVINKFPIDEKPLPSAISRLWKRTRWCSWIARGLAGFGSKKVRKQKARSDRLFCYPRGFIKLSGLINRAVGGRRAMLNSEYGHRAEIFHEVCNVLQDAASNKTLSFKYPLEIRFGAADEFWLSSAYQRDTCYIGFYAEDRKGDLSPFRRFEELLKPFQPRPHWGKIHFFDGESCRDAFPRWNDFLVLREELTGKPKTLALSSTTPNNPSNS